MNPATKRYYVEFGGAMTAYTVTVFGAATLLNAVGHDTPWRYPLAVLPMVPAIAAMVAFVRFLGTMDELQRRIHFEAFGMAFGATIVITFTYGFLEFAGLPRISAVWIGGMMIVLWGVFSAVATRRFS